MTGKAKGGRPRRNFLGVGGMDPAANWLLDLAAEDYLTDESDTLIPFLIELGENAVEPFRDLVEKRGGAAALGFGPENNFIRAQELVPMIATADWLRGLLDGSDTAEAFLRADKRIVLSSPMKIPDWPQSDRSRGPFVTRHVRLDFPIEAPRPTADPKRDVVVAVIDDGIAFAHERFEGTDGGTRIAFFWDMNKGLPVQGAELDKATIDTLIANADGDEDVAYARAGKLRFDDPRHKPMAWRASHGTHVLDLAAGSAPGEGGPTIIAAQLPTPVVARTTGELLDFYLWMGALYALDRAGDRPLAINVSFGYDAGPHDGEGLLEKHLSLKVAARQARGIPTAVVLPAGNAQLSQCHATMDLAAEEEVTIDWIVQPDDRTHSIVEIWLPAESAGGARICLTVTPPDATQAVTLAEPVLPLQADPPEARIGPPGREFGLVELWERLDKRRMFRIAIAPTERAQPSSRRIAPAGTWKLRFTRGERLMTGAAEVWVQRDDSLYGYPQRGRQSYLDHDAYQRFDALGFPRDEDPPAGEPGATCPVKRRSLLNAIATSPNLLVAGGFRERDGRIARYSSGGPNTPGEPSPRLKPDVLLPSDGSPAHPGVLGALTRSGGRAPLAGTSVAAPQLTRHVAAWMAKGGPVDRAAVKAAPKTAPGDPPVQGAAERSGHGRIPRLDTPAVGRFEAGD